MVCLNICNTLLKRHILKWAWTCPWPNSVSRWRGKWWTKWWRALPAWDPIQKYSFVESFQYRWGAYIAYIIAYSIAYIIAYIAYIGGGMFALTFVFATGRDRWPATAPPCHWVEGEMSINISWLTHNLTFVCISTIIINTIITIIITVTTMTDADAPNNHFQGWWAPHPHQRLPRPRHTGVAAWLLCVNEKGIDVYDILKSWQHFPILCSFIRGIDFPPEETLALTLTSSSSTTSTWSTSHSCQRCLAIIITTMFLIYHQFLPKVEGKRTFEFEIALKTKSNEVIFHF